MRPDHPDIRLDSDGSCRAGSARRNDDRIGAHATAASATVASGGNLIGEEGSFLEPPVTTGVSRAKFALHASQV